VLQESPDGDFDDDPAEMMAMISNTTLNPYW